MNKSWSLTKVALLIKKGFKSKAETYKFHEGAT